MTLECNKAPPQQFDLLNSILQMEERYRDNIPEVFQARYEPADQGCEQLLEAISCLEDAFRVYRAWMDSYRVFLVG